MQKVRQTKRQNSKWESFSKGIGRNWVKESEQKKLLVPEAPTSKAWSSCFTNVILVIYSSSNSGIRSVQK